MRMIHGVMCLAILSLCAMTMGDELDGGIGAGGPTPEPEDTDGTAQTVEENVESSEEDAAETGDEASDDSAAGDEADEG